MTPEELEFIRTHGEANKVALHAAFQERFNRPEIGSYASFSARNRNGWVWPRDFAGKQPFKLHPVEYNDARGHIVLKVRELQPSRRHRFCHYQEQRLQWEKENGPIPERYGLKAEAPREVPTRPTRYLSRRRCLAYEYL